MRSGAHKIDVIALNQTNGTTFSTTPLSLMQCWIALSTGLTLSDWKGNQCEKILRPADSVRVQMITPLVISIWSAESSDRASGFPSEVYDLFGANAAHAIPAKQSTAGGRFRGFRVGSFMLFRGQPTFVDFCQLPNAIAKARSLYIQEVQLCFSWA
jgi:hypothetical protein